MPQIAIPPGISADPHQLQQLLQINELLLQQRLSQMPVTAASGFSSLVQQQVHQMAAAQQSQ